MSGFKLLAIRPLKGCDSNFLKVLIPGRVYRFYNDYTFYNSSNKVHNVKGKVSKIELISKVPSDLYKVNDVSLNISAVVGKNGSGKSSLIELLFVANFLLAIELKILNKHDIKDDKGSDGIDEIKKKNNVRLNQLKIKKDLAREIVKPDFGDEYIKEVAKKLNTISWLNNEQGKLDELKREIGSLRKQIKVEIFYQIEENIYMFKIDSEKKESIKFKIIPFESSTDNSGVVEKREQQKIEFDRIGGTNGLLKDETTDLTSYFFYSLVLNYSQYSLNSKEIGNWITELFHKNDGYQTPIVINPMRTEGNFDINTENELVRQRLLVNVLTPLKEGEKVEDSLRHLSQNHIVYRVRITLNKDKFKNEKEEEELKYFENGSETWEIIENKFFNDSTINDEGWKRYAKDYIIGKLISMAEKYPPYFKFYDGNKFVDLTVEEESEDKIGYLDALMNDDSHIAYKFHQAINFLKYDYAALYFDSRKSKSVIELAEALDGIDGVDLKHLIPPSFLTVDILFDKKEPKDKIIETNTLQNLSSGEKQYIYSISSIMYHLRYLDSVNLQKEKSGKIKNVLKYKYKYINLVFDEIELYYHPELQQQFIFDFRNAIERCKLISIKNINCTFITHSPFILSDIPKSNILMLEKGEEIKEKGGEEVKTFGANVYDILEDSFFMSSGFIGKFALDKVKSIIKELNDRVVVKGGNKKLKEEIKIIGEPFLKDKLLSMYYELYPLEYDREKEIESLERKLQKLKK